MTITDNQSDVNTDTDRSGIPTDPSLHDDSGTHCQSLPYSILRLCILKRFPDALLHTFSNNPGSEGLYIKFPDLMDKYIIVSAEAGDDMYANWTKNKMINLGQLIVPNIHMWAYDEPDGEDGESILTKQTESTFTTSLDKIVTYLALWLNGERAHRKLAAEDTARKAEEAARKMRERNNKLFPYKPDECESHKYVSDASLEAAIDIITEMFPGAEPRDLVSTHFTPSAEIGDELQSLVMAAYQRAIMDLTTSHLDAIKVLAATMHKHDH